MTENSSKIIRLPFRLIRKIHGEMIKRLKRIVLVREVYYKLIDTKTWLRNKKNRIQTAVFHNEPVTRMISARNALKQEGYTPGQIGLIFVTFILLKLIKPIKIIRFGVLRDNLIGHTIYETEHYLYDIREGKNGRHLDIFSSLLPMGNEYVAKLYHQQILHWQKSGFFHKALQYIPTGAEHVIYYHLNPQMDLSMNGLPPTAPSISISEYEAQSQLKNLGLEKNCYICFHNRDSSYYKKLLPHGDSVRSEWFNFRDADIKTYGKAITYITESGYKAVRMGVVVEDEYQTNNPLIYNYCNSLDRNDKNDVFLTAHCRFFIGTLSGLTLLPILFKKPVLWVHTFWRGASFNHQEHDLFIFKKLWLRDERRFATFREMREIGPPPGNKGEYYEKQGIEIIDNNDDDILYATQEMHSRLEGSWKESDEDVELQERYRKLLWKDYSSQSPLTPRVSASFLRENRDLLNDRIRGGKIISRPPLDSEFPMNSNYKPGQIICFKRSGNWKCYRGEGWYDCDEQAIIRDQEAKLKLKTNSIEFDAKILAHFYLEKNMSSYFADHIFLEVYSNSNQALLNIKLEEIKTMNSPVSIIVTKDMLQDWQYMNISFKLKFAHRHIRYGYKFKYPLGALGLYQLEIMEAGQV